MRTKLETITREELELERISGVNPDKVYCEFKEECTRHGEYVRCYLDTSVLCPFYKTYYTQRKEDETREKQNSKN